MKKIELGEFIHQVKKELIEAQRKDEEPFYSLEEVELEIDFVIDTSVEAKGKLFVLDLVGQVSKTKSHRIKLKLKPIGNVDDDDNEIDSPETGSKGHSGGINYFDDGKKRIGNPRVVYWPDKDH